MRIYRPVSANLDPFFRLHSIGSKMNVFFLTVISAVLLMLIGCQMNTTNSTKPDDFISQHVKRVEPMNKEARLASWDAAISGKSEDYDRHSQLVLDICQVYSDPEAYAYLKHLMESDTVLDGLSERQIKILYNAYLTNQIDSGLLEQTVKLSSDIQKNFSNFRGTIGDHTVTNNEILAMLKDETDSDKRKNAWLASKQVGTVVADDIIELVKLRNMAADQVGYDSYHTLRLEMGEQDVSEIDMLFEKLDKLTQAPYRKMKAELDRKLAAKCGIDSSEIMPWHYHDPFFQEVPMLSNIDLDVYYEDRDIEALSAEFYAGIGLSVDGILENSDLYEKEGKNPHAFCTDIDKKGDVRILCNITDNEKWMEVQLHELGHAVYAKYNDMDVPYILRNPAHSFTTEAVAMLFGRLSCNALWMQETLGLSEAQRKELEEVTSEHTKLGQVIFARWVLVMYNFEKRMYENPDQDLNRLWWDMVERYQYVKRPDGRDCPDWASKIHFAIAPCYYHNYLLGEMLASQLNHHMAETIPGMKTEKGIVYVNQKEVGSYLRKTIFEPGNLYHYNDMIRRATGEGLTPKYFVDDFVH